MNAILLSLILVAPPPKPVVQGPPRLVQVESFTIKCSRVSSGTGASLSLTGGNTTATGSGTGPAALDLTDPVGLAKGLQEVLESALADSPIWAVVKALEQDAGGTAMGAPPSPEEGPSLKPQFLIRATITDLNVSSKGGGLNISGIGGSQNKIRNRVVLDLKLIDPATTIVVETVKGQGVKETKHNFLGTFDDNDDPSFGWKEFQESPLAEACDLAIKDGLKRLEEKLAKYPWMAEIVAVREDGAYINVGPNSGLATGQILEVVEIGEPIVDAKSGRVLGSGKVKVLGTAKVVEADSDLVVLEAVDGLVLKPGQKVRLKKA